jgi:peptidoglycan/xylan/chitin deacetylase (PgdA/CDA1 family)
VRHLLLTVAAACLLTGPARAQRVVSITLDDLPYTGASLEGATHATEALLAALDAHGAPADVFVTGSRIEVAGEAEARRDLVRRWRDAGHPLHNHSYSHPHYSELEIPDYLRDVERGDSVVTALRAEARLPGQAYFYRPPYNDLGKTAETRRALAAALEAHGARLAPFTVEHVDWMFDAVYGAALTRGDSAMARRVGQAYLAQLDTAFAFAEKLSTETFGREIPQILLIHANRINGDYLAEMLEHLRARGYAFISLDEAVADPAYATADEYTAQWGVSWLHRWRVGLGLPNALRDEPEPPPWVVEAN